jgi:hypothetical protein
MPSGLNNGKRQLLYYPYEKLLKLDPPTLSDERVSLQHRDARTSTNSYPKTSFVQTQKATNSFVQGPSLQQPGATQ